MCWEVGSSDDDDDDNNKKSYVSNGLLVASIKLVEDSNNLVW